MVRSWPAETVVSAAMAGDRRALEALVAETYPHVRGLAFSICASGADAEYATQEAILILFRKVGTLRATAALSSWLFRVVWRECSRLARSASRLHGHDERWAVGDVEPSAEVQAVRHADAHAVVDAIVALPVELRRVLVLRDVHQESGRATARRLGLSVAAMKSRLHRARGLVRLRLAEQGVQP